ncbi:MAG: hypothetical protein US68_C0038G0006 [Candidatus Shapirobacteria bacterium GW2011_GWE1_38_10]|uniref:Transmembrane protein n=2 Tax=Microgenomates group TaxID=1794810 RepID=A0A0G0IBD7_9BACT|nr:MAG: hypothetical protein US68_C0038G0006 [Candidatus Shapirobacteria bacterium GW2011_GWE1_38_10]OGM87268.1 MAG: hypothetical protein A2594_01205 [Candidatus Woesebacteria bacterium RIFOXYD1_FULL_41_28]
MKKLLAFLSIPAIYFAFPRIAYAHCPLCVAGTAFGITLTRLLGVDDSITGIWIGALLGAISFWTYMAIVSKLKKGSISWLKPTVYLAIFASTLWSFYKFGLIIKMEKMFGLDKLTFGILVGGAAFYLVEIINNLIVKIKGKSLFPYQRIAFSLGMTAILSIADYILIGYYI